MAQNVNPTTSRIHDQTDKDSLSRCIIRTLWEEANIMLFRSAGTATQQVSKRLQSELMTLMMSGDQVWDYIVSNVETSFSLWIQGISAFPDGDNLLSWIGTVEGPKDSVYDGLKYKLRLEFPAGRLFLQLNIQ